MHPKYRSPDQRIVDGIREFYLGMLSKHLPHEAFDMARSDRTTKVAMECLKQIRFETAADAAGAPPKDDERLDALAHEIWAAAQLVPGEGITDGVDRIAAILKGKGNG